jgi:hypothetical protein
MKAGICCVVALMGLMGMASAAPAAGNNSSFASLTTTTNADAASFLFDGFYLGMSKAEASRIHPEAKWMMIEPLMLIDGRRRHGPPIVSKGFNSLHLGKVANVVVTLDKKAGYVHSINFVFSSTSSAECVGEADEVSTLLKQTYGIETEIVDSSPDRHSMWRARDNSVVVWHPYCDYAPAQFSVTYLKDGG